MSELVVKSLTKSFRKQIVLNDFSFQCKIGQIIGVFGRNGSGKSTLLKCILGTLKSNSIIIIIDGEHITPKKIIPDGRIGYLPQDSFLPKEKKVRDIIPLIHPKGDIQDRIFYAPNVYKIDNKRVGELSLGELRYLEILLLTYLDHQFLMLDEPFSMIQPIYKDWIKELLLSAKEKKGILITDHYYEDVLEVTDTNMIIKEGKPIAIKNKKDLINHGYLRK
ncbi:ATP-binding cassette domain-containing protein [Aquimarina sp. AU474]|uniref:ATP-binding cassette domain-containing protein n=1 Tax=Aquimarina sp. AU474 TaxID=2108529 RepID=UPI000D690054|nr:ATP-binding cassette domain-containing protein [Aquimarina sp. AU474]